ncbi:MAG: threonylcarbamoyl-AMP synthase [Blastocatellia bacterium]|nr:threonylcarbamoyl-AMP synthase [Blastocatellia bacterium]
MLTVLTTSPDVAAEFIRNGGIVAFPTETVYGLGANVFDEKALGNIFEAKNRPADNPFIVHVASVGQIDQLASDVPESAHRLVRAFFPGPLTVVLPKSDRVPMIATAGLGSVGVRMPSNKIANRFISACGTPIAAPSANLSGRPSPTTWEAVYEDLKGRIDCILQGELTNIGLESTVVDCTVEPPAVLRPGAISVEQLRRAIPSIRKETRIDVESPKSPGLKHRHYSPTASVVVVDPGQTLDSSSDAAFIGISTPSANLGAVRTCQSVDEYARNLYEFFRECDRQGIKTIYCETVSPEGIGAALMDRLTRASELHPGGV